MRPTHTRLIPSLHIGLAIVASKIIAFTLIGSALLLAASVNATPMEFTAHYQAEFRGMKITAERQLARLDNGDYLLSFSARSWMAKIDESTRFTIDDCLNIEPREYHYKLSALGNRRFIDQTFDWANNKVASQTHKKQATLELQPGMQDRLSYQLQLQWDLSQGESSFSYPFTDKTRIKRYQFEAAGTEIIDTGLGKLDAIRVNRIDDPDKTISLWFDPNQDYLLVKLQETENGKVNHQIDITSVTFSPEEQGQQ